MFHILRELFDMLNLILQTLLELTVGLDHFRLELLDAYLESSLDVVLESLNLTLILLSSLVLKNFIVLHHLSFHALNLHLECFFILKDLLICLIQVGDVLILLQNKTISTLRVFQRFYLILLNALQFQLHFCEFSLQLRGNTFFKFIQNT